MDTIDFRQLFWSILGQITWRAFGLEFWRTIKHSLSAIPVAIGKTKASFIILTPAVLTASNTRASVSLQIIELPAALG